MSLKLIFRGRLEFGNQRSFEKAQQHFAQRTETVYRLDVLFKIETAFDTEAMTFVVPPNFVVMSTEKHWRTTTLLLDEISQYAIGGHIKCWALTEGQPVVFKLIEPSLEKSAFFQYNLGRELSREEGKELEAIDALNVSLEKYESNALAYERRGRLNFNLGNYKDARHDFEKAIKFYDGHAESWFGLGKVKMVHSDWQGALEAFTKARTCSIALQPIFWQVLRRQGQCFFHLKKWKEASENFAKFLGKHFEEDDVNSGWRRKISYQYGRCLLELGEAARSVTQFTETLAIESGRQFTPDAEMHFWRGLAQRKLGKKDFVKDIKAAAEQGHAEAVALLAEL